VTLVDRRVGLLFAAFVGLLSLVLMRAVWVQGIKGSGLRAEAQSQQTESVVVPGSRGTIRDRNGKPLAVSEDAETVFATPYQVTDPEEVAHKLAKLIDGSSETEILKSLADRESGFAYLARKVDLTTAQKIQELDLPGIGMLPDSRRIYPQGELASQVIGSVGVDNQGLSGLEASEETVLHGTDGEREVTRDALGDELERDTIAGAKTGSDLKLSLDANIQAEAERVLAGIGQKYQPAGATAIVMDPRNSEVLAMANWPTYDPTEPGTADPDQLRNMATGFTYEPGSTFKAFTVAGALQDGVVTPDTTFPLGSSIQVADRTIEESHEGVSYGTLSVADILKYSSNIGAVTIGLELNGRFGSSQFGDRFDTWVRKFGFDAPTGIQFPGEERGIVIPPKDYSGSTMGNLPIGQGLSVTPMQMAAAYSAIASDGVLRTPRLILDENGQPVDTGPSHRVVSPKTAEQLRTMLEGVFEAGGTAQAVSVPGYVLAGKTGTAQKVVDGTYSDTQFVASFVGFAPAEDPQLLVAVVVDDPKGDYYGGTVAAPAFGDIVSYALPYLGIPPDQN
jgi:cell division protein FtsI (penicillin-binding protein 3)